jgi:hypothetical protein
MSEISREYDNLYNPSLGAAILYYFAQGYGEKRNDGVPLPLLFIVLPMILQEQNLDILLSTKAGLRKFINRFSEKEHGLTDSVLSFHLRVDEMVDLSKRSLQMALLTKLLVLSSDSGALFPISKVKFGDIFSDKTEKMMRGAKRFGSWCSELSLFEIGNMLRVEF